MKFSIKTIKLVFFFLFATGSLYAFLGGGPTRASNSTRVHAYQPAIPRGISPKLWRKLIPADNPMTAEKVALGESLYFDKRLSADGTVSCATCHDPATAFADNKTLAVGVGDKVGTRNAPTILNAMFNEQLFWDGRASSLEEQAKQPLVNPLEMGMPGYDVLVARLRAIPEYRQGFRQVFGTEEITLDRIVKAIAAFERTQLTGNSPFDRFIEGDSPALTSAQKRGWELFRGKAKCIECHTFNSSAPFFTDAGFHNTGVATKNTNFDRLMLAARQFQTSKPERGRAANTLAHTEAFSELGRYLVTGQTKDIGAFKTPTLRDIELTAPYMHNASEKTLLDVVRLYNRGGEPNAHLDKRMRPLNLTDEEMNNLVEFMRALTSDEVIRRAQTARPQTRATVFLNTATALR